MSEALEKAISQAMAQKTGSSRYDDQLKKMYTNMYVDRAYDKAKVEAEKEYLAIREAGKVTTNDLLSDTRGVDTSDPLSLLVNTAIQDANPIQTIKKIYNVKNKDTKTLMNYYEQIGNKMTSDMSTEEYTKNKILLNMISDEIRNRNNNLQSMTENFQNSTLRGIQNFATGVEQSVLAKATNNKYTNIGMDVAGLNEEQKETRRKELFNAGRDLFTKQGEEGIQYQQKLNDMAYSGVTKLAMDAGFVVGDMTIPILLGIATGNIATSAGAKAGMSAEAIAKLSANASKVASLGSMYTDVFGHSYTEAIDSGASTKNAELYAHAMASAETASELIGGETIMSAMVGRPATTLVGKFVAKGTENIKSKLAKGIIALITDVGSESVEEVMTALVDPAIKKATLGGEDVNVEDVLVGAFEDAIGAIIPSIIFMGMSKPMVLAQINNAETRIKTQIQNATYLTEEQKYNMNKKISEASSNARLGINESYDRTFSAVQDEIDRSFITQTAIYNSVADLRRLGLSGPAMDMLLEDNGYVYNTNYSTEQQLNDMYKEVQTSYSNMDTINQILDKVKVDNKNITSIAPTENIAQDQLNIKNFFEERDGGEIVFVDIKQNKGKTNAFISQENPDVIFVNSNLTTKDTVSAIIHEKGHYIKMINPELYNEFVKKAGLEGDNNPKVQAFIKDNKLGNVSADYAREEMFGNYVGEVNSRGKDIQVVEEAKKTFGKKIKESVDKAKNKAFNTEINNTSLGAYNLDITSYMNGDILNDEEFATKIREQGMDKIKEQPKTEAKKKPALKRETKAEAEVEEDEETPDYDSYMEQEEEEKPKKKEKKKQEKKKKAEAKTQEEKDEENTEEDVREKNLKEIRARYKNMKNAQKYEIDKMIANVIGTQDKREVGRYFDMLQDEVASGKVLYSRRGDNGGQRNGNEISQNNETKKSVIQRSDTNKSLFRKLLQVGKESTNANSGKGIFRRADRLGYGNELRDVKGRKLSEGIINYFKNTTTVDRKGNLLVFYHGSNSPQFYIFDKNKIGSNGTRIAPMFEFTLNEEYSRQFTNDKGSFYEVYLKIENPYDLMKKGYKQLKILQEEANKKGLTFSDYMESLGYDGIKMSEDEYGVFEPNQIKLTSNLNPTSNSDIRYSQTPEKRSFSIPRKATQADYSEGYTTSDGTPITNGVANWAKDSAMRNEDGKLDLYYHGSPFQFEEFNPKYIHSGRDLGDGNYLTKDKAFAKRYAEDGNLYTEVLNVKNPFNDKTWLRDYEKIWDKIPELVEKFDQQGIESHKNWGKEGWIEQVEYDMQTPDIHDFFSLAVPGEDYRIPLAYDIMKYIKDMAWRNSTDSREIWRWLGYDGLETDNEVVIFDSNQAKAPDNPNPTSDSRFKYSQTGEPTITKAEEAELRKELKVEDSMTPKDVQQMITETFHINEIKEWYDNEYKNADEWLKGEGVREVADYVENTSEVYYKYLQGLEGLINNDFYVEDIIQAYADGKLSSSNTAKPTRLDTSTTNPNYKDEKFYAPKKIPASEAKAIYETAIQKATGLKKKSVYEARAKIIIASQDREFVQALGIDEKTLNKNLRSWANYSEKARKLSMLLNEGVSDQNRWSGLENSSILSKIQISDEDLEAVLKGISGNTYSSYFSRGYILATLLAIDTHTDYSNLWINFTNSILNNKDSVLGNYVAQEDVINIRRGSQNTVAHEIGHFIDYMWGRQFFGMNYPLSDKSNQFKVEKLSPKQQQFVKNFYAFIDDLNRSADNYSKYTLTPTEIFARFVAQFVEWTNNIANGSRYYVESSYYGDRFTFSQYREFVKLLQEKSLIDTTEQLHSGEAPQHTMPSKEMQEKAKQNEIKYSRNENYRNLNNNTRDQIIANQLNEIERLKAQRQADEMWAKRTGRAPLVEQLQRQKARLKGYQMTVAEAKKELAKLEAQGEKNTKKIRALKDIIEQDRYEKAFLRRSKYSNLHFDLDDIARYVLFRFQGDSDKAAWNRAIAIRKDLDTVKDSIDYALRTIREWHKNYKYLTPELKEEVDKYDKYWLKGRKLTAENAMNMVAVSDYIKTNLLGKVPITKNVLNKVLLDDELPISLADAITTKEQAQEFTKAISELNAKVQEQLSRNATVETAKKLKSNIDAIDKASEKQIKINGKPSANRGLKTATNAKNQLFTLKSRIESMYGGDPNTPLLSLDKRLKRGEHNKRAFIADAYDIFSKFTTKSSALNGLMQMYRWKPEYEKMLSHDAKFQEWVKGTPKMSKAMVLSLYLHSLNDQNMKHISGAKVNVKVDEDGEVKDDWRNGGGVLVPNEQEYRNGSIGDAYKHGTKVVLTPEQVSSLVKTLTPEEKAFADSVAEYYKYQTNRINEVSRRVFGYDIATVENYFPIHAYLLESFASNKEVDIEALLNSYKATFSGTNLFNQGQLKERTDSFSPIYLENIVDVLTRSVNDSAAFYGYAEPIRENRILLDTVYRDEKARTRDSVKAQIDYLDTNFMKDYNELINFIVGADSFGKRTFRNIQAMNTLTFNMGTWFTQPASFFNTYKYYKNIGEFLSALVKSHTVVNKMIREYYESQGVDTSKIKNFEMVRMFIREATPVLDARALNFRTPLLSKLVDKKLLDKLPAKFLQLFDDLAVTLIARMQIANTANYAKFGTLDYFQQLGENYEMIMGETQPDSAEVNKAMMMRNKNPLVQGLTLFGTPSNQIANNFAQSAMNMWWALKNGTEAQKKQYIGVFARAVGGILASNIAVALIRALRDRIRDDEGKVDFKDRVIAQAIISMASPTVIGDEIASWIMNNIDYGGVNFYDLDTPDTAMVNNIVGTANKIKGLFNEEASPTKKIVDLTKAIGSVAPVDTRSLIHITEALLKFTAPDTYKAYALQNNTNMYKKWSETSNTPMAEFYKAYNATREKSLEANYGWIKGSKAGTEGSKKSAYERALKDVLPANDVKKYMEILGGYKS